MLTTAEACLEVHRIIARGDKQRWASLFTTSHAEGRRHPDVKRKGKADVSHGQRPEMKALVKQAPATEEEDDSRFLLSPGKVTGQIRERVQFLKQPLL